MPVYVCISFVTYEHPLYRFIVLHRGRFVYCPFLLVRFTDPGRGYFLHKKEPPQKNRRSSWRKRNRLYRKPAAK